MELGVTLAFLGMGGGEIALVLLLVVLLFGAQRIPDVARALGRAQARFASARDEIVETLEIERTGISREQMAADRARDRQMAQQAPAGEAPVDASDEPMPLGDPAHEPATPSDPGARHTPPSDKPPR